MKTTARSTSRSGLLFAFAAFLATASTAQAGDLTVVVENIESIEGTVNWALYDSAERWEAGDAAVVSARSMVFGGELEITLHELPEGRYAIKLIHDANLNGDLDRNALGLPTEGYGFSNNAGRFGPPSFDDAAFEVGNDSLEVRVRVR